MNKVTCGLMLVLVLGLAGCGGLSHEKTEIHNAGECLKKTVDGIEYAFRWCPAGTFTMGSPNDEPERSKDETQHEVTLTQGFWMMETEVTQAMWQSVMGSNPSAFKGDTLPVESVSWEECLTFCTKLSAKLEMQISLPTEAQWEYACRAGTTGPYAGDNLDELGWYFSNTARQTCPVKQKKANAWGLYDMHGNVWEWCLDRYGDYPTEPVQDPTGPVNGSFCVHRGGNWIYDARFCRSAYRDGDFFWIRSNYLGLRVIALSRP